MTLEPEKGPSTAPQPACLLAAAGEGCEHNCVPPWVDHVCTDQIMVEVHTVYAAPYTTSPSGRVRMVNNLLHHLDARGYDVFAIEPNPVYPENCWEWSLVRRTPCEAGPDVDRAAGSRELGHALHRSVGSPRRHQSAGV